MSEKQIISSWTDETQAKAFASYGESIDSFGAVNKARADSYYRDFKSIEPNISVRSGFTRDDYYAFRPNEQVPEKQKRIIKSCMEAYDKVGIVRNIIDLMGDFGCQGIEFAHENKSVEDFYRQWFKKVNGKERSERFLNNLYRTGNVVIYRSMAKVTPEIVRFMRSSAADIKVEIPKIEENVIPWRYTFFNPLSVEPKDGEMSMFMGRKNYELELGSFTDNFSRGDGPLQFIKTLPDELRKHLQSGSKKIPLDPDRLSIFYYKKDDWNSWANPMIYAILDDIAMLEKMRLADLAALDGAISNIRLWTLGDLEHKILPTKAAIDKLRNILSSNTGGGTMELVWGPELKYTESNSQVYKFLGSEKYSAVLNSIFGGLGVPPTLTGMSGNGSGMTNNFISLKTLVERLQYGRDLLTRFWEHEAEIVRKAMGFRKSPHVTYDQMSLSDEATEKQLLIQLSDRDIISNETVLARFKEIGSVEQVRLAREGKLREEDKLPEKVSPFIKPESQIPGLGFDPPIKSANPQGGRPINSKDTNPRKKRSEKPRSAAELFTWATESYEMIDTVLDQAYLSHKGKSNLRQLTKAEFIELADTKFLVLANADPDENLSGERIKASLLEHKTIPSELQELLKSSQIDPSKMPISKYRTMAIGACVQYLLDNTSPIS